MNTILWILFIYTNLYYKTKLTFIVAKLNITCSKCKYFFFFFFYKSLQWDGGFSQNGEYWHTKFIGETGGNLTQMAPVRKETEPLNLIYACSVVIFQNLSKYKLKTHICQSLSAKSNELWKFFFFFFFTVFS